MFGLKNYLWKNKVAIKKKMENSLNANSVFRQQQE